MPEFIYQNTYYPLGFAVRVTSNSDAILDAAQQSWGGLKPLFRNDPLEMRLGVKESGVEAALPQAPVHNLKGNLLMGSADAHNFFIANLQSGRCTGWVSERTAQSALYLRYFFLEAAALSMVSTLRAVALHAACVSIHGHGVLLCGDSGVGKSTLSYAGARSGWAYVSDDASYALLGAEDPVVVGNCRKVRFRPSAAALFPEIDGRPVTPRALGKPSIEVPTSELPIVRTAATATIGTVIFLNRGQATEELRPLSHSELLSWFMQHVMATPTSRSLQEDAILRLLRSGVYELRYHDLGWAIRRINQLVEERR
jgi:hypothetical protein